MSPQPIPPQVLRLLRHPDSSKVLSMVSTDGYPHSIVLGALIADEDGRICVGEAFMYRSSKYLEECPRAEFLVWMGKDGYSLRADVVGHVTEGPDLDRMNELLGKKGMHASALWVFQSVQVWDESASYTSGDRIQRWTPSAPGS
ncbi:MAG: pyridoxamine 5'-phosphate oxidase family protein [Thermoplasmata archaeon]|nr:pyridoxamine 5'-phosphate oxidase family protein [Thermoplasmata archaeon]